MTETSTGPAAAAPAAQPSGLRIPFGWRGLILGGMALAAAGFWMSWGWLTAIGAAPLIVSLAPCAVMCGLGICCMKGGSKSCGSKSNPAGEPESLRD